MCDSFESDNFKGHTNSEVYPHSLSILCLRLFHPSARFHQPAMCIASLSQSCACPVFIRRLRLVFQVAVSAAQVAASAAQVIASAAQVRPSIPVSLESGHNCALLVISWFPPTQGRLHFATRIISWSCFVGWEQPTTSPKARAMLPPIDEKADYAVCVHLVAVIMHAWFATARTFVSNGRTGGCQYEERCRTQRSIFELAVSADMQAQSPSLKVSLHSHGSLIKLAASAAQVAASAVQVAASAAQVAASAAQLGYLTSQRLRACYEIA